MLTGPPPKIHGTRDILRPIPRTSYWCACMSGLGKRKLRALQAHHIRSWLNGLRTTCQCFDPQGDAIVGG